MTVSEAARRLNVTPRRVQTLINQGHLRAEKGRYGVYTLDTDDFNRFLGLDRAPGKTLPKREDNKP